MKYKSIKKFLVLVALTIFLCPFSSSVEARPSIAWDYMDAGSRACVVPGRDPVNICAWQENHKEVVRAAMNRIRTRIGTSKVERCTIRNTKLGKLRGAYLIDYRALARTKEWPRIRIVSFRNTSFVNGRAFLKRNAWGRVEGNNIYDEDAPISLQWEAPIRLSLNLTAIERSRDKYGLNVAADRFAGTILHEVLHQMNHKHPNTGDYSEDYEQGHFVTVAGDCLMSNGVDDRVPDAPSLSLSGGDGYVPSGGWPRYD